MALFTTRVQLNGNPGEEDYESLHAAMKAKGFSRFVKSDDGKRYHMPHAEYTRMGDLTRSQVLQDANAATAGVWRDYQVLVTEGSKSWYGLKEATRGDVDAE